MTTKGQDQIELAEIKLEDKAEKVYDPNQRYYPIDEGYDKRVYENTWYNYIIIIVVLIVFYALNTLFTWGMFEFGIWRATYYTWYSLGLYGATLLGMTAMLISGSIANRKTRYLQFLIAKEAQLKGDAEEKHNREKQDREY
jgi:hypothetical protein